MMCRVQCPLKGSGRDCCTDICWCYVALQTEWMKTFLRPHWLSHDLRSLVVLRSSHYNFCTGTGICFAVIPPVPSGEIVEFRLKKGPFCSAVAQLLWCCCHGSGLPIQQPITLRCFCWPSRNARMWKTITPVQEAVMCNDLCVCEGEYNTCKWQISSFIGEAVGHWIIRRLNSL